MLSQHSINIWVNSQPIFADKHFGWYLRISQHSELDSQPVSNGSSFHLFSSDQDVDKYQPGIYRRSIEIHMYRSSVNLDIDQGLAKGIDAHYAIDMFSTHDPKLLLIFFSYLWT